MMRGVVALGCTAALVACMLGIASPANAYWSSGGSGFATGSSGALEPPRQVVATSDAQSTTSIDWVGSSGPLEPEGYYVERTGFDGTHAACGTSHLSLETGTSCIDGGITAGLYSYRVTAVFRSWTAPSVLSDPVMVATTFLGSAAAFSVLGTAVTTTGFSRVSGDLGVSPGIAVVGFPDGIVAGEIHAGDSTAAAAQLALVGAYADLASRPADAQIAGDLVTRVLSPGVYHAGAALGLSGILTLDGGGDPNAIFIFQVDAAVTTAASSAVVLINGATASNVYWVVNAAVTTGALSTFEGNILAQGAIGLGAGAQLIGRALSRDAVTMADNVVRFTEALPPAVFITGGAAAVTKDTTPAVSGTTSALAGRVVTVTIAGQTLTTSVLVGQTWSVTAADLLAGTYPIVVKLKDAAGNGATAAQSLLVEVNPATTDLGLAASFSIVAGSTIVSTGVSHADGDVGVSPGSSISGLPQSSVGGAVSAGNLTAANALAAVRAAVENASDRRPHTEFTGDLIGRVFHAGVHHTSAAFALTGTMTLDAEGDPNAVFIFQVDAAMNTAASSSVLLANGAKASNVFWMVDAAVDTGGLAQLPGTILATGTITLGAGTHLTGRALTVGAIVMADTTISRP
jgi:hypothetical protein